LYGWYDAQARCLSRSEIGGIEAELLARKILIQKYKGCEAVNWQELPINMGLLEGSCSFVGLHAGCCNLQSDVREMDGQEDK
jgi:hypothetical protein